MPGFAPAAGLADRSHDFFMPAFSIAASAPVTALPAPARPFARRASLSVRILVREISSPRTGPGPARGTVTTSMTDTSQKTGDLVIERTEKQTKEPARFKVLLINDDYTTMDFVVEVLETVFHRTPAEAFRIMMQVHTQGKGLCGVYTFEVAETKVEAVHELARQNGFPLRASLEEE
jgi:ATP-dependent Clp protease adaptor protein ClpS